MTASRRIFLTGMPASGKTTLGQAVARLRPGWILVDVDSEIEARRGLTVPQIFAADGEAAFRALENEVMEDICRREGNIIVCTGGGTPCADGRMEMMRRAGTVVLLDAPVEILARRVRQQPGRRPLLEGCDDLDARLEALRKDRNVYYNKAHYVFDSSLLDTAGDIERSAASFVERYIDKP